MSVEWTTETEREYQIAVQQWEADMRAAEHDPEIHLTQKPGLDIPWINLALTILGGCVAWAMLAVFCWGGNLVPRW